jgi:hypothetical protein
VTADPGVPNCDGGAALHATVNNPSGRGRISVTAAWTNANGGSESDSMKGDGTSFDAQATGLSPRAESTWTATLLVDGAVVDSDTKTIPACRPPE